MPRRNGFTLIETLMVIVVVSLTGLIAIPRLTDALSQATLRTSRAKVMSFYAAARASATTSARPTYLHLNNNRIYVTALGRRKPGNGVQDTVTAIENVYTLYGATLLTTQDSIRIDPSGLGASGATTTIRLLKGSRVDTILVSPYGRVQK